MQVLTRGFLLYFDRSELQFVGQETMTELRFVWPLNVTGHYFRALTSDLPIYIRNIRRYVSIKWKSRIVKKDISITRGRIASRIPLTLEKSKSDAPLNSVTLKQ